MPARILNLKLPKIYPITDELISGISHAEQVRLLIAGGATLIQLREKHAGARAFYESAAAAVAIARERNVQIVINDRVDIALALKTGVHLGQDDLPPDKARQILGPDAIIGFSTHNIEQAKASTKHPVDYIAIGPIFQTQTKQHTDPVIGVDEIRAIKEIIHTPLVAIGGITKTNLADVFAAGADSAAMIGAVIADPLLIEETMRRLMSFNN